jgi:hypothetical protein
MTPQTAFPKQRPIAPRSPARRPADPRSLAEEMLHELAFVFHVTHAVKQAVTARKTRPAACDRI